jgi:hypothetical protein
MAVTTLDDWFGQIADKMTSADIGPGVIELDNLETSLRAIVEGAAQKSELADDAGSITINAGYF